MPDSVLLILMRITLDLPAEEVSGKELGRAVLGPFTTLPRIHVIVHDMAAAPPPKLPWLQQIQLVVSHLVVRDEHRTETWESAILVLR